MTDTPETSRSAAHAFTFGDPEPVLGQRGLLDYIECWRNGKWYEPPIDLNGLAQVFRAATHHSSAIYAKRNILLSTMEPSALLSRAAVSRIALEFLTFGNCYLEQRTARSGKPLSYEPALAKFVRRDAYDLDQYWFTRGYKDEHAFRSGSVWHLLEPDLNQEIYGLPEYLSSLHSTLLNEAATLFRRRYYSNGSHAGFILYMTDAAQQEGDVDALRKALKDSKGPGNFRNLFVYAPNGKKDGMQLIPVSEVAAKDEFMNIKNVTRDDQMAAHRVPWQLMGMPPPGNSGTAAPPGPVAEVFARNELEPLQARFLELNEWAGEEVVRFKPYSITVQEGSGLI
ncbi:MAG: phage portal protein [Pseudomonas sp.]|uniref:phage portal protein n=1 Tax=Pseudomonas sp. TaxID=306 RepID=UPI003391EAA3